MKLRRRKTKPEEVVESIADSLRTLGHGVGTNGVLKATMITGGVAALTAASAAVSSLRRRMEVGA
jgi:hypothetical protein